MPRPDRLQVLPDAASLAAAAADLFATRAAAAVRARGRFRVALAGGSTPRATYALLADPGAPYRDRVEWPRVEVFFGDERFVPADHPDSNYRMAREALLAHVPVRPASVHRVPTELATAELAAAAYERELAQSFGLSPPVAHLTPGSAARAGLPRFDLVLLGMGTDGHTASLFPGTETLGERARWVAAPYIEALGTARVTLTYPVLDAAAAVAFVVAGADKAEALQRVVAADGGPSSPPAARVRPAGELVWLVDAAAAARIGG